MRFRPQPQGPFGTADVIVQALGDKTQPTTQSKAEMPADRHRRRPGFGPLGLAAALLELLKNSGRAKLA
jgi:hypothetical protein